MGQEIERKWRVRKLPEEIEHYPQREITQAYLNFAPVIRIRRNHPEKGEDSYELTYKGSGALSRREENLPLDEDSFRNLLKKSEGHILRKKRYCIPYEGYTLELDVFQGDLQGLFYVEVEFPSLAEAKKFQAPSWFSEELTEKEGYSNAALARQGFVG